ncbi:MAG: hypothetical protein A3C13_04860 [Candidatus Lloydbacteria bacterium RIFCSPHIGHO2_02_FULL_50_11]|nr:MAG: hypothetical protein A3C13_04860 [Candidatus Lloydbacteria bacterium RIFCSPHIGHO2_02_FULL_50_11]
MKPKIRKLQNGLRMLFVPMEGERTTTALVLVETGSKYETKAKNGISHFLEHMCFKGTKNRPNQLVITRELDSLGAEFNAFTGYEYTGYYVKAAAGYLPQVLDLLSDVYCNSLFKKEDIEQEKGAIVGEINMHEDMPMRKVGSLFMKLLYGDQPAGWEIAGSKHQIATFTREDFLAYRKRHYVPEATVVIVAGNFDEQKTAKLLRSQFGKLLPAKKSDKRKVNDGQTKPAVLCHYKDSDQTHLVLGVRSFALDHKDYPTLGVLGAILGAGMSSRLFQKIRTEMGLGYYVNACNESMTDHGIFSASAGVVNERVEEAVSAIIREFSDLKNILVGDTELKKAKDMLAGRLLLGLETSDDLAEFYGFQEILRRELRTPEELIKIMRAVTKEDIQRVAKTIFVDERLNLALVGPWKNEERLRALLKF